MSLDFNGFMNNLQKTKGDYAQKSTGGKQYPYRLIFVAPNAAAKLTVRILVNKKINAASFTYHVHKLNSGATINCGLNNPLAKQCALCDALTNRKNLTGIDSQEKVQTRSLMMAQYVSSVGYDWAKDARYPEPKRGDIILVGGPATLHRQLTDQLITAGPANLPALLTAANGRAIVIGRDDKGKQVTVSIAFDNFQTVNTDQDFDNFLNSLPSLSDIALFGGVSQDDYTKLSEAALAVERSMATPIVSPNTRVQSLDEAANQAQPIFQPLPGQPGYPTYQNAQYAPAQATYQPTPQAQPYSPAPAAPQPVFQPMTQAQPYQQPYQATPQPTNLVATPADFNPAQFVNTLAPAVNAVPQFQPQPFQPQMPAGQPVFQVAQPTGQQTGQPQSPQMFNEQPNMTTASVKPQSVVQPQIPGTGQYNQ